MWEDNIFLAEAFTVPMTEDDEEQGDDEGDEGGEEYGGK